MYHSSVADLVEWLHQSHTDPDIVSLVDKVLALGDGGMHGSGGSCTGTEGVYADISDAVSAWH